MMPEHSKYHGVSGTTDALEVTKTLPSVFTLYFVRITTRGGLIKAIECSPPRTILLVESSSIKTSRIIIVPSVTYKKVCIENEVYKGVAESEQ